MRQYDHNTGLPLPTKEEWKQGKTSDNLEDEAIMRLTGRMVAVVLFMVVLMM